MSVFILYFITMLNQVWQDVLKNLRDEVKVKINFFQDLEQLSSVKDVVNSISLKVWQIRFLDNLFAAKDSLKDKYIPQLTLIFENEDILAQLLCSGDVPNDCWPCVVEKLCEIIFTNQQLITANHKGEQSTWKQRLAIATALTFCSPVKSLADHSEIDGLKRFGMFCDLAENDVLFPAFYSLSTWHLRYVVGSWAQDKELSWARDNVLKEFATTSKIGEVTHKMVPYRLENDEGVSVHEGSKYYKNKPATLQALHEVGGVCGAVSKFGAAMSQAHGIPAMPVGQPGHCAFMWWKDGKWVLSNDCSGLKLTTVHDGIQLPWCTKNACFVHMMNEAQARFDDYKLSEMVRIVSGMTDNPSMELAFIKHATSVCPENFLAWKCFATLVGKAAFNPELTTDFYSNVNLNKHYEYETSEVLSHLKPVKVSDCDERAKNLVDGTGSEWWSSEENCWIEIDLQELCLVEEVKIQWWGLSVSQEFMILASDGGQFVMSRTSKDDKENKEGYNSWSCFDGWSSPTQMIKLDMQKGKLDPWGMGKYFGIRQILVKGYIFEKIGLLDEFKTVKTSAKGPNLNVQNIFKSTACSSIFLDSPTLSIDIKMDNPCFVHSIIITGQNLCMIQNVKAEGSTNGANYINIKKHFDGADTSIHLDCQVVTAYVKLEISNNLQMDVCNDKIEISKIALKGYYLKTDKLFDLVLKKDLIEYPLVQEVLVDIFENSSCEILSHQAPVTVSHCSERASNIVDGTGSEWWTGEETAWIEIDFQRPCLIHDVGIQWWGSSWSSDLTILATKEDEEFLRVKMSEDAYETPEGLNEWTRFKGWSVTTRKVRFVLRDGHLDPWGLKKYFGVRQIIIRGVKI